jgi:glutamate synthase domain-containing protein 2
MAKIPPNRKKRTCKVCGKTLRSDNVAGFCHKRGCQREYSREYNQRPEVKERRREKDHEYLKRPEVKERQREYSREYRQRPEVKERQREREREYRQRPEVKERRREQNHEYRQRTEFKERRREYNREYRQRPEVKDRLSEKDHEYSQRPEVKERALVLSRLAGKLPKVALRRENAPGYRGGRFVVCMICGLSLGWKCPSEIKKWSGRCRSCKAKRLEVSKHAIIKEQRAV